MICIAGVDFVARDLRTVLQIHILLHNKPVQTGIEQRVGGSGGLLDLSAQAVPGLFADIEHRFNICGHFHIPPK